MIAGVGWPLRDALAEQDSAEERWMLRQSPVLFEFGSANSAFCCRQIVVSKSSWIVGEVGS